MLKTTIVSVITHYIFQHVLCFYKMLGPADITFQNFEHCNPPKNDIYVWVSQKRYNRTTHLLDITLSSPWQLDDSIIMEFQAYIKRDGTYKPGSVYMKDSFCKLMKALLKDLFDILIERTGLEDCPIPAGSYQIDNFFFDSNKMPDLIYGEFKAEAKLFVKGELKGCFLNFLEFVPKEG